ncbi:hypothetical protein GGR53DRAFT_17461 [Hypoxylon sp. FL1150]|nr:hypothetical protein GGR53DRAFT_17461 [Hypoxylon sp. FL1150]
MPSIGPQLPPHLTKRKRTPEDESAESPATKLRTKDRGPVAQDEVDLSSDDEDGYGPSVPRQAEVGPIGPAMPPSNTDEVQLDDSDEDDIGPTAPPPPPSTRPSIGPSLPPSNNDEISLEEDDLDDDVGPAPLTGPKPTPAPTAKRVHGPAPPPAPLSERPPAADSDSDDDDYGPALPTSSSHLARQTQAQIAQAEAAAAAAAAGPKRDDWMLAPPSASGPRAADPTKIKNRRFNSGPRASTSRDNGGELSSIWTETPEQKRKRLENAVLGRESQSQQQHTTSSSSHHNNNNSGKTTAANPPSKEDAEQQERIRNFTEATRGKSLYEEHRESREGRKLAAEEAEDDPSARAFDKEKDMKLGGRIGTAQRRELLNRAADFGGRFAKGKYL